MMFDMSLAFILKIIIQHAKQFSSKLILINLSPTGAEKSFLR